MSGPRDCRGRPPPAKLIKPREGIADRATHPAGSSRVIVVSVDELAELVRDAVRAEFERRDDRPEPCDWIGVPEAAELLGVHPDTVGKMARKHGLPVHRVGRKLRFRRSELEAWVESRGMTTHTG